MTAINVANTLGLQTNPSVAPSTISANQSNQTAAAKPSVPAPTKSVIVSLPPIGGGGAAPTPTWTIDDAVDAFQRNSSTVPATINLKGTTTDIQQNMAELQLMMAGGVTISSIKLTDHGGSINLDASTFTASGGSHNLSSSTNATAKVLQKVSGAYTLNLAGAKVSDVTTGFTPPTGATIKMQVVDSAANVGAALQTLSNNKAKITNITLTDPTTPLTVTVPQIAQYKNALTNIVSYKLAVSSASIKDWNTKLSTNTNVGTVSINDTAANINASISTLENMASAGTLQQVTVSDGKAITIDQTTALADTALLNTTFVNGAGGSSQTVTVSGVDYAHMNTVEDEISSNKSIDLGEQISDTSSNVSTNLSAIANAIGANHIGRISFTDPTTPTLTFVNKADYAANKNVLQFVRGNYNLSIGNISAADAVAFTAPNSNASMKFNISDTASSLATNFDALQTLAAAGKVTTIKSNDAQGAMITLTASQVLKDSAVLTALNAGTSPSPYSVEVTEATAANISALTTALGSHLNKISFSDTAANLSANMSQIVTLAATTKIGTISATGGALNIQGSLLDSGGSLAAGAKNLFGATFTNGTGHVQVNIQGIASSHAKDVNDLVMLNSSINNSGLLANETVSDTATNISSNMNSLEAAATTSHTALSGITVRDGGTVTVADINEFTADKKAIDLIKPNYTLAVTKASVADAGTIGVDATVTANAIVTYGISDTAANITSNLSTLSTLVGKNQVSSINSSDGTNQNITFTATQIGTSSNVLNKITTGSVEVTGASATQAAKWLSQPLSANISKIDIDLSSASDTSDLVKNIAALNTNYTKIGSINLGANALTLDATTAKANKNLLSNADFSSSTSAAGGAGVALTVNGLSVSDLSNASFTPITANKTVTLTDNVTDTAAQVSSALDALQANSSIGTVKVSDPTNSVTVNSTAQYTKDETLISTKLSGNLTLSASNLTVADALSLSAVTPPGKMSYNIVDTAANITSHLSDLKTFAGLGELSAVTTTDGTNKAITIDLGTNSVSDLSGVISKIQGNGASHNFAINVTGATAAQASSIQGVLSSANSNATLSTVSITDSGADIAANLANLQSLAASNHIGAVDVKDGVLTLSAAQVTASSNFLSASFNNNGVITSPVTVTVTGVSAANVGSTMLAVNSNAELSTSEIDVSDTATNLHTNIASLEAAASGGIVKKIVASDGGTITLDETTDNIDSTTPYDPMTSSTEVTTQYKKALAVMTGTYGIKVTGISSQNVDQAYENITGAASAHGSPTAGHAGVSLSFGVVDNVATLVDPVSGSSANLDNLQTYAAANQLSSIKLTAGDVLGVSVAQLQSDKDALAKLDTTVATPNLAITDAAATIVDTAHPENLADVNSLIANHGSSITTVVLKDSTPPALSIAQINNLNTALNAAHASTLADQITAGWSYTITDHLGAILNQAGIDGTTTSSITGGASSITLLDNYSGGNVTLPSSEKTVYTALYSSMTDAGGNPLPDPTATTTPMVNWV